jgi:putative component of membrane protein insertase Oxa1/YidC/SpoIIIJ protein YidD
MYISNVAVICYFGAISSIFLAIARRCKYLCTQNVDVIFTNKQNDEAKTKKRQCNESFDLMLF